MEDAVARGKSDEGGRRLGEREAGAGSARLRPRRAPRGLRRAAVGGADRMTSGSLRVAAGGGGEASDAGGHVRRGARRISRVRVGRDPGFSGRGLYIGIEGARRVQMRCGFRPRDHDRML